MAGAAEDVAVVVDEGAVMAFEVAGREAPVVVAIGAVIVAVPAPVAPARSQGFGGDAIGLTCYTRLDRPWQAQRAMLRAWEVSGTRA